MSLLSSILEQSLPAGEQRQALHEYIGTHKECSVSGMGTIQGSGRGPAAYLWTHEKQTREDKRYDDNGQWQCAGQAVDPAAGGEKDLLALGKEQEADAQGDRGRARPDWLWKATIDKAV